MKMDKVAGSGNDEFYTPAYAVKPLLKYIDSSKRIWCPFDTDESIIVKEFLVNGNTVKYTHLSTGHDFFHTSRSCDVIVSNPPYSLKAQVFESLFERGVPFAMLVGIVGLFESQKRFNLFKNNDFEIMYLNKRVSYFKTYDDQKPSLNPPFSSAWVTSKLMPSQIVFEEIEK